MQILVDQPIDWHLAMRSTTLGVEITLIVVTKGLLSSVHSRRSPSQSITERKRMLHTRIIRRMDYVKSLALGHRCVYVCVCVCVCLCVFSHVLTHLGDMRINLFMHARM